jgi:filamentous hemagglutinin family protein
MNANHIYRVIWSEILGIWVAVSEITRTHGKRSSKALHLTLPALAISGAALAADVPATVIPTGSGTSAYVSANGVPVVNIKAANAAGLSHNQYLRYDVETKGLVLNNGNLSKIERPSQLAGRVLANPNLASEASVILNEVVSSNRSLLEGFTEVVGGRADVVLANPNGITCSGCGFINTDRATLTTGIPVFNGSGGLGGFNVGQGDIFVQGAGLNASAQQILDLVARSIMLEAPVVTSATGTLQLAAGANRWSYESRAVTGSVPGSGPVPTYAIDSSVLGGMYAGRVRLIATEAGVGVRMLGEAAASADDFRIDAAGRVSIQSRLSAARDLALTSTAAESDAVAITDSTLTAGRNLDLSTTGGLVLAGGMIKAANNVDYQVATITDSATATALTDGNKRFAGNQFSIHTTGVAHLDGVTLGAGNQLIGNVGSLAIGTLGATLYGDSIRIESLGAVQLGSATVQAGSNLTLRSSAGGIVNGGLLLANEHLDVSGAAITNLPGATMAGLLWLKLATTSGNLLNGGLIYTGPAQIPGGPNEADHNPSILVAGTFHNQSAGEVRAAGSLDISADTFINNNLVEAVGDLAIATTTSFRNEIPGGMPQKKIDAESSIKYSYIEEFGTLCIDCNYASFREETLTEKESWVGGPPVITQNPQIMAGNNLTIEYGSGKAENTGGLLYAGNDLLLTGTSAASFTNADIALYQRQYKRHWLEYLSDWLGEDPRYYYMYARDDGEIALPPYFKDGVSTLQRQWGGWLYENGLPAYRNSPSPELDELARQRAYKQLQPNSTVNIGGVQSAYVVGKTVTLKGGTLHNNSGEVTPETHPVPPPVPSALPTNPNGFFVPARNSSARYLIELNPLYAWGSQFGGSDYLIEWLGMDPETTMKRLGDANYEAYLIRQQLVSQTGSNVLAGYGKEADQMQRLMDQAVLESKNLGLTFGQALTKEQAASLTHDIVWMVETVVAGQTVLAPVVYLAPETRHSIVSGAVIAGQDVTINLVSVSNTGGTISGSRTLSITSQGDIVNTAGTLQGGDVSVRSTEGSIVNQRTGGLGDDARYKVAVIGADGSLVMEAKQDISVRGAEVKSGGDASLAAGGSIVFDTVVNKTMSVSRTPGSSGILVDTGPSVTIVTTEKNIGASLSTGGSLQLKSGGDTTLAGTKAEIGQNLTVDAGGSFNILSRQDKTTTHTETQKSGIGVGGGLWGSERTTTDDFIGKNFGSSISVGGDADIKAERTLRLQGSDLDIGGSGRIDAGAVKIEQGLDERRTVTQTQTSAFLTTGSDSNSNASAQAAAGSGHAAAEASAGASASASESSEFNLMESRTTTVEYSKTTGVASNLTTGDGLDIKAREAVTVQGSNVESGGNLAIDAQRIDVLAGRNEESTTTTTSTTKIGIYTDSKAEAKADAGASATGMSATARAGASAEAEAGSTVTLGVRTENSTEQTTAITHTASTLKSGGDMTLKAAEEAKFVGSQVESGGNLAIEAKDITSLAAQDSTVTTSSSSIKTAGIYLEGEASAKAGAEARVGPTGTNLEAGAEAGAEVSAGLRYAQEDKSSEQGSVTNRVSTFKAGGDITRKAAVTIMDQGTQLEAGGNITQTATTLKEIAAEDKTWSSKSSESHDGRIGVYAGASASTSEGGDASAGVKGKYTYGQSSEAQTDTTAVVSRYKAGGSISSTTTDKTTLIGTQFEAGKDVSLGAGSLDYQAARDTHTSSSGSKAAEGEVKAKLVGSAGAELSGSYDQSNSSSASSTARIGSITAGGNVTVRTQGDARFEGTDISAGEKAKVESTAGNVVFDAAKSTSSEQSSGFNVSAKLGTSSKPGEGGKAGEKSSEGALGGGYSSSSASSTTSKAASIKGRDVEISAGRDVTMEGTQVKATDAASVVAGGAVKLLEAKDSAQSSSFGIQGGAKASSESKPESEKSSQSAKLDVKVANEDRQTGKATKIQSGGNLTVKGASVTSQQAELVSGGQVNVQGPVQQLQKTHVDKGLKVDVGLSALRKTETAKKASSQAKATDPESTDAAPAADGKPKPVKKVKKPKNKSVKKPATK